MRTRDDRGQLVPVHDDSGAISAFPIADQIHSLCEECEFKSSPRGVFIETACIALAAIVLFAIGLYNLLARSGASFVAIALMLAGTVVLSIAITHPKRMKRQLKKLIPELHRLQRAHQRCAACSYNLVGVTPEPDGCTVCPECGGAWMVHEMDGTSSQD